MFDHNKHDIIDPLAGGTVNALANTAPPAQVEETVRFYTRPRSPDKDSS